MRTNIQDQRFGQLVAKQFESLDSRQRQYWIFTCDCGKEKRIRVDHVKSGKVVSCGCFNQKQCGDRFRTHGLTNSDLHTTWTNLRQRCMNEHNPDYKNYGARGIYVCPEWDSFETFAKDMGERPSPAHTIERKDNEGPYCKDNCVWATRKEQANNRR